MTKSPRVFIPLFVFAAAAVNHYFTTTNLESWYMSLQKPSLTPPDWIFAPIWVLLYASGAYSAVIAWENYDRMKMRHCWIKGLFRFNLLLTIFWSYLFFVQHEIWTAFLEISLLNATTLALIILLWKVSKKASLLLVPYLVWVSFATYLNYQIWVLNSGLVG